MAEGEKILTDLADIQVGMRLEAMDKYGKWYIARVIEVDEDGGDVLVHFEGWSSRYDEYVEVKEGRLRTLTSNKLAALLKEKKAKRTLIIGDRVQAKWEDGRMYFGKVVSIRGGDVEVLFDDGVYYTAPFSRVRKRNMDKAQDVMEDYLREPPLAAAMEARKRRAEKRRRNDDSASQTSLSSPPSSPVFMPKKVKPSHIDDDSTETESDVDDGRRVRIRERPFSKQTQSGVVSDSPTIATFSKGGSKSSSPASSDSEQSRRPSRKYEALREPYKLRGVTQLFRLSPVDEDPMAKSLAGSGSALGSAFLTPPFEPQTLAKSSQILQLSSSPSPRPSLGSTPPETPELGSRSQRLRKSASALASGSSAEDTCASSHGKKSASDSDILVPFKLGDSRGSSSEAVSSNMLEDKVGSDAREEETPLGKKIERLLYCEENWEDFVHLLPKRRLNWSDSNSSSPSLADHTSSFELESVHGVATASAAILSTHFPESQQPSVCIPMPSRLQTSSAGNTLKLEPLLLESSCEQEVSFVTSTSRSGSSKMSALFSSSRLPATDRSEHVPVSPPVLQLSGGREMARAKVKCRGRQRTNIKTPSSLLNTGLPAAGNNTVAPSRNVEEPTESGKGMEPGAEPSKRIVSDSATPTPSKQIRAGSPLASKKQLSPSASSSSVATRTRAQTKFEHVAKKSEKKPAKIAPKELVIMWDHNEHKCKFTGCGKSFRKETLLLSHVKHYHHIKTKTPAAAKAKGAAGATVKPAGKSQSPMSPKSPRMFPKTPTKSSPKPRSPKSRAPRSPKSRMLRSPKSPSLKSILSPPQPKEAGSLARSDPLRRSKSPTESFFESMEKQHRSIEVMKLLEQSAREQAAALSRKSPPVPLPSHPSSSLKKLGIAASPTALKFQLPESSITSSGKMTARAPEYASPRPTILQIQQSKPKSSASSSKQSTGGSKKMKQVVVRALSPLKFPLVEIKALPKDSLPLSPTKKLPSHAKASHSPAVQGQRGGGRATSTSKETGIDDGAYLVDEGDGGVVEDVKSPSVGSEGNEDDVVHCVCGSEVDEGFMIQCEQCLCWQHGDCIGITKETLPEKYICYICTNPPGLRTRLKHRFDRDWFADGSLPSFPGGPKFPEATAIRMSHRLADSLFKLRKMVHSTKVKLQAASNPNHPYLRQWAKECAHISKEDIMSYLIAALQPVSYESGDTQEGSPLIDTSSPVEFRPDGGESSAGVEGSQEPQNEGVSKNENGSRDSDTNVPLGKLCSPINMDTLCLDPLPQDTKSHSVTPTPPPSSSSFSSYPSLTTTAESSLDPKSLKLAPLPPLSVEDLRSLTGVILKSPLQQSTPAVTPAATLQTTISGVSESLPTLTSSASLETVHKPSISFSENPIPEPEKSVSGPQDFLDLEISEEFGVQEMSVFAVDRDSHPTELESKPPQVLSNEQELTTPLAVASSLTTTTPSVPLPIPSSSKLISSSRSAFKPVIIPITSSSAKSPLTTLLSSQQATSSRGGLVSSQSSLGSVAQPTSLSVTESSGNLGLQPKLERNPIFTPTLSSLSSVKSNMDTVTLGEFAEAFMHGDMTNWVHRMLLYDHVEAVQNKVMAWMDLVEKQLEEIPCDESSLKDMNALLTDVQSVVRQLGQVQHIAASESS